jgi:DNA-binding transcriptional ArsR family regulator
MTRRPLSGSRGPTATCSISVLLEAPGAYSVNEIAERTTLSQPAVSHHLKIFRDAGLLDLERGGARRPYSVTGGEIAVFAPLTELIAAVGACRERSRPNAARRRSTSGVAG